LVSNGMGSYDTMTFVAASLKNNTYFKFYLKGLFFLPGLVVKRLLVGDEAHVNHVGAIFVLEAIAVGVE